MQFRNFKMVDYVVYGRGAFNQLDEILAPRRKDNFPMIFFVHFICVHSVYHVLCRILQFGALWRSFYCWNDSVTDV